MFGHHHRRGFTGIEYFTGEHFAQHTGQRILISGRGNFHTLPDFRGHIVRRAQKTARGGHSAGCDGLHQAKIGQEGAFALADENVLGFYVSVNKAFAMRVAQRLGNLLCDAQGFIPG